jgi:beta-galactosidase beta subunit
MIFDHISNIAVYKDLSPDIYEGLMFLQQATPDLAPGTYQISPRVKAIVSEYETKVENEVGYEAHRKN